MENLHLTDFPNHSIQIHIRESVGNPKYIFEIFILQNKVTSGFQEAHFGKNIVHTRMFMQAVPFWMPHIFSFLGIHLGQNTFRAKSPRFIPKYFALRSVLSWKSIASI